MDSKDLRAKLRNTHGPDHQFTACCPAHDDRTASLSVGVGDDGRILLKCHAGCVTEAITGALGITMDDLFATPRETGRQTRKIEAEYIYPDADGRALHKTVRYEGKKFFQYRADPDKPGRWVPGLKGVEPVLYHLPEVLAAIASRSPVIICEGEKDADNLTKLGFTATTSPMGAGKWRDSYTDALRGADVYISGDNDEPGRKHVATVEAALHGVAASVKVIDLVSHWQELREHGDITDYLKARCKSKAAMIGEMKVLMESAIPFEDFASVENENEWPEIVPFNTIDTPPFPLDALPQAAREFVYAAAETAQAPVDMVGSCVLGVLEIACRGRYPVRLPNGHIERPCFYIAPIAPPSERKSGVIDVTGRPLVEYEIEYNQEHSGEVNQSKSELKLLQGRIASAEQQAIKEKDAGKRQIAERELQALNSELAEFEAVEPLRLFGADVTPEKLAAMLKAQGGMFALVSAEGGGLFENIGRYSDKGGLEIYLNGYSGDRICVDRKTSESIVIDRPTLNIIAPCQPSVIVDLFSDKQKSGRGLLSRIMFVKCPSRVGSRGATSTPLDERIANNYTNLCYRMLSSEDSGNLAYDPGGFEVYCKFFDEIEPQLTPDIGELSFMADWAGKLHGQMTRLAGLVHCIAAFGAGRSPLDTLVNAEEARAAVALAKYYLAHAKAVYGEQAEPESVAHARYLWERIKSIKSLSISKRELIRKTQGKQDFVINDSLAMLVERGYIRVEVAQTGNAGRPAETILVNPEAGNIVTLLTKSSDDAYKVNKVTTNTSVPCAMAAADYVGLADISQRPASSGIIPPLANDTPPSEGRVTFYI